MKIDIDERICFDEFRASDRAALVAWLNDRDIYDRTLRLPYPYTEADADNWLAIVERSTREHGQPTSWAIRTADGQLIGGLGFDDLKIGAGHRADIGYWIAKPFWGRGVMTAAVARACRFAFAEWGLAKIGAFVFVENYASARVLAKCGFEREGRLRKHFRKGDRLVDADYFALLAENSRSTGRT